LVEWSYGLERGEEMRGFSWAKIRKIRKREGGWSRGLRGEGEITIYV